MNQKPKILITIGGFLPGYKSGGPVPSIVNLVARLGDEFEFSILTADRDLGDTAPYPDIPADEWISAYGATIRYCSPARLSRNALAATIREVPHDMLYLNSFFEPRFSILPLFSRRLGHVSKAPVLLAPRGEFSAGALALKQAKKRAYLKLGAAFGLFRDLHWHASTAHEAADIQRALGAPEQRILIASDLAAPRAERPATHCPRAPGAPLRVLFLSRITPKKNLEYALDILSGITVPVVLSIIGPEEDIAYTKHCRTIAGRLPKHIQIHWGGGVPPAAIPQTMAEHDLFFLPTRGENFGHVIAEALGAGTPVLLSDTTPWRGLNGLDLGNDIPLADPDQFRAALITAWHQGPEEAAKQRRHVAAYARDQQRRDADVEANRILFRSALGGPAHLRRNQNRGS
jgi:glycosyltransferase involved in cell wall biosynthesis